MRKGLQAILESNSRIAVISEVTTYEDLKNQCSAPSFDLVIAHQQLIKDITILPKGHFVLLLTHPDKAILLAARDHNACGYISANVSPEVLLSILNLSPEEVLIDPALGVWVLNCISSDTSSVVKPESLTPREKEVLELRNHDLSNSVIADHLSISVNTVKTHVAHISSKRGTKLRTKKSVQKQ